jgi:hypothetical protein
MLRWLALALTAVASPALSADVGPPLIASADLGFSGAVLTIRSSGIEARTGVDHRTLILITANNRRFTKVLNDGGGRLRNWSLNLYSIGQNKFVILSEKDCVSIDPVKGLVASCQIQKPCSPQLGPDAVFLGRFDLMNGFDRPRGTFGLGFRYLPSYDATCGS